MGQELGTQLEETLFMHTSYEQTEVQAVCELVVVEEYQAGR